MSNQITNNGFIVIPDVHGRSFWRDAIKGREDERIVFLGDYLDPYSYEGFTHEEATQGLRDIIDFKRGHMDNVVLLLGNHDLGYLCKAVCECRMDYLREKENRALIEDNLELFDLTYEAPVGDMTVLFSHAGIHENWAKANRNLFGEKPFAPSRLNEMLHSKEQWPVLWALLCQVSYIRGGNDYCGSPVWADAREYLESGDLLPGYLHVFGHTQHSGGAILLEGHESLGWCADCARAFRLDGQGKMSELKA